LNINELLRRIIKNKESSGIVNENNKTSTGNPVAA